MKTGKRIVEKNLIDRLLYKYNCVSRFDDGKLLRILCLTTFLNNFGVALFVCDRQLHGGSCYILFVHSIVIRILPKTDLAFAVHAQFMPNFRNTKRILSLEQQLLQIAQEELAQTVKTIEADRQKITALQQEQTFTARQIKEAMSQGNLYCMGHNLPEIC